MKLGGCGVWCRWFGRIFVLSLMLTRKQRWRRTVSHPDVRKMGTQQQFEEYLNASRFDNSSTSEGYGRTISEPTMQTKDRIYNEMPRMRRCTTGDISDKHVHFSERSRVILVPTRQDYRSHGFSQEIWWEENDYEKFKVSAKDEVLKLMEDKHMGIVEAMSELYQPESETELEEQPVDILHLSSESLPNSSTQSGLLTTENLNLVNLIPTPASPARIRSIPHPATPSPSRKLLHQGSIESVDSQSSVHSGERRAINFLDIRSEGSEQKGYDGIDNSKKERHSKSPIHIHPLALMADM